MVGGQTVGILIPGTFPMGCSVLVIDQCRNGSSFYPAGLKRCFSFLLRCRADGLALLRMDLVSGLNVHQIFTEA